MIVKDAYINILQGLQNIAAFVNSDVQLPELDVYWNEMTYKFIELVFMSSELRKDSENLDFQEIQASLDDLKNVTVKDASLALTVFAKGKYGTLPNDYNHLVSDRTLVAKTCGKVLQTKESQNRLTGSEDLNNWIDNYTFKTNSESPISSLNVNSLYVYSFFRGKQLFDINQILIDYVRNPVNVAFTNNGGNGAQILELPNATCYKIIRMCIIYISKITQQPQQKIVNITN